LICRSILFNQKLWFPWWILHCYAHKSTCWFS